MFFLCGRRAFLHVLRQMDEEEIWRELGPEGFEGIAAAFYERVRRDSIIGPMYPEQDWEGCGASAGVVSEVSLSGKTKAI